MQNNNIPEGFTLVDNHYINPKLELKKQAQQFMVHLKEWQLVDPESAQLFIEELNELAKKDFK